MGIFNFIKDVGQKLLHTETAAAQPANTQIQQKLQQYLEGLNLGIQNPKISVEGDKATIEGSAADQDAFEKAIIAIGNTNGIAQVESKIQTAGTVQVPKFYTVKKGDTLSKIAKETLGDANKYNEIFKANQPLIKNVDEIYPGQQLRIPQAQQNNKAA